MEIKKLCVIGDPVSHSKSPIIHNSMLKHLDLPFVYDYQTVKSGELEKWFSDAKKMGYVGFNATMPHKVDLLKFVDEIDEDAKMYGAINTVSIKNDKVYGYNTDGKGFLRSLEDKGVSPKFKEIVILGAGGAASAVALKLASEGAKKVTVCNRSVEKAEKLCENFPEIMFATDFSAENISKTCETAEILINCTSLGMEGTGKNFESLEFLNSLPSTAIVCDLIYYPEKTELLFEAEKRGLKTLGGLKMLVYQAVFAMEFMTGERVDVEEMARLVINVLSSD